MKRRIVSVAEMTESWGLTFVSSEPLGNLESRTHRPVRLLLFLLGVTLSLLFLRVGQLTLFEGAYYRSLAEGNRVRATSEAAPRGTITDRSGTVLATNAADWRLIAVPGDLPGDAARRSEVLTRAARLASLDGGELASKVPSDGSDYHPALLATGLTHEQALSLQANYDLLPGITVEAVPVRSYPFAELYAHALGYTGQINPRELASVAEGRYAPSDLIGKTGLEARYEDLLHGINGARQIEVDSSGRPVKELSGLSPEQGYDLKLTLDHQLQTQMSSSLATMLEKTGASGAVGVALDPRSGAVLSYVSLPSYDTNKFSRGISGSDYQLLLKDPGHPLLDRVIAGIYPPGSTIKPFIGAVALDAGTITPGTTITGPAQIQVGGSTFPDWRAHGPGINLQRAIAVSSDVYFYGVGGGFDIFGVGKISGLGIERLSSGLSRFAFGQPTGIDLPGEGSGILPTPEWKRRVKGEPWYLGDTYHASIGQGDLSVTPLQLVTSLAAIANGGTIYRPHLVEESVSTAGVRRKTAPKVTKSGVYPPRVLAEIRSGMREMVTTGSGRPLADLPVEVAGKTGTAEYDIDNRNTHAWFEGFAPLQDPRLAIVVMIEGGGESFEAAIPVAREILAAYFRKS